LHNLAQYLQSFLKIMSNDNYVIKYTRLLMYDKKTSELKRKELIFIF